jgi:putative transposase
MSLKVEFVERASKRGARMAVLCREFGISRETGYKWLGRFKKHGYEGLEEQSRRPRSAPLATGEDIVLAVLKAREAHPSWGPKKLLHGLQQRFGDGAPSRATVARILRRFGKVRRRPRLPPMSVVERAPAVMAEAPNEVWSVDFKGWWRAGDGSRCEPLTVRDAYSRYVLCAELVESTGADDVMALFKRLFRRYGIPAAIQCDNGSPFVSVMSRGGLTRLSAWWVSLGIRLVRSRPGCPQDNGGHERMHRDISAAVEVAPSPDWSSQQRALARWRVEFNHVRPHEALGGKTPHQVYRAGARRSIQARPWVYPPGWVCRKAYAPLGVVSLHGEAICIGKAFVGYMLGLEPVSDTTMRVWLHDVELGEVKTPPHLALVDTVCVRVLLDGKKTSKKAA